MKNMHIWLN